MTVGREAELAAARSRFGCSGARLYRAPGRVNLIGGQVDYHEGLVVAMAIDRTVEVTATPTIRAGRIIARSASLSGVVDVAADGSDDPSAVVPKWGRLLAGVVRSLADAGRPSVGARLEIDSTLPIGTGLSSSAAFAIAVALALSDVADFEIDRHALAAAAQRGEHLGSGVPCGIQDQIASVTGGAFLLDCRSLAVEPLSFPEDLAVVVVDSGVSRMLEHTAWASRRAESLAVAERLGLEVLRDATHDQVVDLPRGRHVVGEIERVRQFADAVRHDDRRALGDLMVASHASSRDDMECSVAELDSLVEGLVEAGAYGARMTGGGFGGCCVAIADRAVARSIAALAIERYTDGIGAGRSATSMIVRPGPPAGLSSITTGP